MSKHINWPICDDEDDALLFIDISKQKLFCVYKKNIFAEFSVSTGQNGVGEQENSGCTPRGMHVIADIIGKEYKKNAVFVGRQWTGEIYSSLLAQKFPQRDWILSRIIRLKGLEKGFNLGAGVDTFDRFIYIHGTPDKEPIGIPNSHGCIRMRNNDVIKLSNWIKLGVKVFIEPQCINVPEKIELIWSKNNE